MRVFLFASCIFTAAFCGTSARADLVIDSFSVGPQLVIANSSNGNVSNRLTGLDPSEVFEGERNLVVQGAMSVGSIRAEVAIGSGTANFDSFNPAYTNSFLGRFLTTYINGNRNDVVDLSVFQSDSFVVDFNRTAWGASTPDAELLLSSTTGIQSIGFTVPESATAFSVFVPLSQFNQVDFSRVFNIQLDIGELSSTASFEIDRIRLVSAVPEPSSAGIVGVGLIVICMFRRLRPAQG